MSGVREALASPRFCEWLDATAALECGWPHSPSSAVRWVCAACGVDALEQIHENARAYAAFEDVRRRFAGWVLNRELGV